MKNNKGITLIALVITIIVMLILVGVTITVAMEGGLFNTARRATTGTETEKERELQVADGVFGGKTIDEWVAGETTEPPSEVEENTVKKVLYSYDGTKANEKEWAILYDYGDAIEIVSPDVLGSLTLGSGYEETVGDIDKDGTANTQIDKAIYSYNKGVEIINNYCKDLVTNPNKISVRSLGSCPDDPYAENTTAYELEECPDSIYNNLLKSTDQNYRSDDGQMNACNYDDWASWGGEVYWVASRVCSDWDDYIAFSFRWKQGWYRKPTAFR